MSDRRSHTWRFVALAPLTASVVAAVAAGSAYLLSPPFATSARTLLSVMKSGDVQGLRMELYSFGALEPAGAVLMVAAQTVVAPWALPGPVAAVTGRIPGTAGLVCVVAGTALGASVWIGVLLIAAAAIRGVGRRLRRVHE